MSFVLILQLVFIVWFFILHFISIPPINDLDKYPNKPSWKLFLFGNWTLLLLLIVGNYFHNIYCHYFLLVYLGFILFGHINTWWLPYLFGFPKVFIDEVVIDQKVTLRFLPDRKNRPVPDVGYSILGLTCFIAFLVTLFS